MIAKLNRLRIRDLGLFVVVAGIVAVSAVFAAREAGLGGGRAEATEEQLSLVLSMSEQICETKRAEEFSGGSSHLDEDGNRVQRKTVYGWSGVSSLPVKWQVSGGQEPFTLVIDHESADQDRDYRGATGIAQVGCADTSVGTSFWPLPDVGRLYDVDPQVDSGRKTVRAVVTDGNGDTAEATVEFYVILNLGGGTTGEILKRGETYHIGGVLMTAPRDYDVRVGSQEERECAENDPDPRCGGRIHWYLLVGVDAWIALYEEDGALDSRWPEASGSDRASGASADPLTAAVDSMVDSLGKLPQRTGNGG